MAANYLPTQEDLDNPCQICEEIYDGVTNMTECVSCLKWYHDGCINDPHIVEENWTCKKCLEKSKITGIKPKPCKTIGGRKSLPLKKDESKEYSNPERKKIKATEKLRQLIDKQQKQLKDLKDLNQSLVEGREKQLSKSRNDDDDNLSLKSKGKGKKCVILSSDSEDDSSEESDDESCSLLVKLNEDKLNRKGRRRYDSGSDSEDCDEAITHKEFARYVAQQEVRELPKFDGTPSQWPSFYRSYKETKSLFSDVANRNRLQKALTGKALKSVAGLLISPSTVREVIRALKHRYGQSEHIIQEAIDMALSADQPQEKKPDSIVDYAMLVLTVKANIDAVGEVADKINPMLIKTLVQRLPIGMQKKWCRFKREKKTLNKIVKLSTFSRWLMRESEDYADLVAINSSEQKHEGKSNSKTKKNLTLHHHQQPTSNNCTTIENKKKFPCFKCSNEGHQIQDCEEFKQMSLDKRQDFARKSHMCFVCLRRGHQSRKCYHKRKGTHPLICDPKNLPSNTVEKSEDKLRLDEATNIKRLLTHRHQKDRMLFKIVPVILYGPVSQLSTYALIDDGASTTLLEEEVATKLQLGGKNCPLVLGWTKDITNCEKNSMKVKLSISGIDNFNRKYCLKDVRTVQNLSLPVQDVNVDDMCSKYPYLKQTGLCNLNKVIPTILLGLDNANLIAPLEIKMDPNELGPIAMRSKLGWSIHGPEAHQQTNNNIKPTFLICECHSLEDEKTSQILERYFSLDDFGIKTPKSNQIDTADDKTAKAILEKTTKRIGCGFETGLLWRESEIKMPNNYNMCIRRLISIEIKMAKDETFSKIYCDKIKEYVSKGYARKLDENELLMIKDNMWFLPHFGVITANKPKLRLVFDARAIYAGHSLNSKLLTGPDCYSSLVGVIFKFRQGQFAVTADVREMFHQVNIREEDQRFQCFLWRGGDSSQEPDTYVMQAMIFGAKCSPCSAQYVKNLNAKEHQIGNERAVEGIINRFYVDDYLDSFSTEKEALEITSKVIEINRNAKFELRNVISNSKLVRKHLGKIDDRKIIDMNVDSELLTEKVLGLHWDTEADQFVFKLNSKTLKQEYQLTKILTKRELLRITMSLYDPLGLIAHYVVRAKIILNDVWLRQIEWDDPLPGDIDVRWRKWFNDLDGVKMLKIPRNYAKNMLEASNVQLHIFCDASERAFSAVAYVRVEYDDRVEVQLIAAKTKIAPQRSNKVLSMPRLELQGAILGTRLSNLIVTEHSVHFKSTTYWTDSQTVLSWVHSQNGIFKPYVAHRIAEITDSSNPNQWRYVPSLENPADDATKVTIHEPFAIESRWFQGPKYLVDSPCKWPADVQRNRISESDPEVKRVFTIIESEYVERNNDYQPIDPEKFSSWHELKRITAWVKRGIYNWSKSHRNETKNHLPLSMEELLEAECYLIKKSQLESFSTELKSLKSQNKCPFKSKIENLCPFIDNKGVMRMDGRIERSPNVSNDMKKPIILDRKNQVTKLILMEYHKKFHHQFQEAVVNEMRTRFWIPQIRVAIKETKKRCQQCKNDSAVPQAPKMAKLPLCRVDAMVSCFHYCGIDLFGPLKVAVKRSQEKRWGVVFTCLTTRAIYIDLVPDLTSDSLILAIRNCNCRRGPIKHMFSDCGTNMKGANSELQEAIEEIGDERIQRECLKIAIEWHYNPPASPHMGGCWERMVRSIKNVLTKIMKEVCPKEHVLRSLFCEVEDVINSRPLTYIALENDTDDAITPKHFLNPLFRSNNTPPGMFNEIDLKSRRQWRVLQELANHFWKRWIIEYLPMLTRTSKWFEKTLPLKAGDIVVICDSTITRNKWEKAIVVGVNKAEDGQVRSALVRTSHGTLTRPVVKLAKLDVDPGCKI